MATNSASAPRKVVVVTPALDRGPTTGGIAVAIIASVVSVVAHAVLILLMMSISVGNLDAGASAADVAAETVIEEPQKEEPDLTNPDLGNDSSLLTQFDVPRIEEVSVPGPVDPTAAPGIVNAPEAPAVTLPPPPGSGGGTGGAPVLPDPGVANPFGTPGGIGGPAHAAAYAGRSGATRERLVQEGGGNALSEAAVARGLEWLALHQAQDGRWSLDGFHRHARDKPYPAGKTSADDSTGAGTVRNDIAGTAFGLLPFLAAGQTHKPPEAGKDKKAPLKDYSKGVDAALKYLIGKQGKDGYYGGDMYAHCLASIAMCEAFGMTSDPRLRVSAQKAIDYLADVQDPAGGGWRYRRHQAGDTSVTGWALMALKSGQMSGLSVPAATLRKAERFLDSVETAQKGGYKYQPTTEEKRTMTAVGLLCRLYQGIRPNHPGMLAGVQLLKKEPPAADGDLYYEYYATQVMHQVGGDSWKFWNEGPDGKSGIRDTLIRLQNQGTARKGNAGSWDPAPRQYLLSAGGRLAATSLSLLTLEVYYRHLPLYRRDLAVMREAAK